MLQGRGLELLLYCQKGPDIGVAEGANPVQWDLGDHQDGAAPSSWSLHRHLN